MLSMRFAILADIHGNMPALEAVLQDIRTAGVNDIICLGDIANVGPHPAQCLDVVRDLNCVTVQGNHELYLLGHINDADWETCPTWSPVRWARRQLRAEQFDYMASLPFTYTLPDNGRIGATFVHASPLDQYQGFLPHMSNDEIGERMNGLDGVTLFCAHTHRQLYRPWSNSRLINVGSVGMPLDGTPLAKYVIATRRRDTWQVEFRAVTYNIDHLMAEFDRVGLQEEGSVITAAFRYQMLTGKPAAYDYFADLRQAAQARGVPVGEIYPHFPVPEYLRPFLS